MAGRPSWITVSFTKRGTVCPAITPNIQEAVELLANSLMESGGELRPVLKVLFTSDFFKEASFSKVKSPVEMAVGTVRLAGDYTTELGTFPKDGLNKLAVQAGNMGQTLYNPPSVEGWHTGKEWIDSGALVQRVNFASSRVGDATKPGIRLMLDHLADRTPVQSAEELVDGCLEYMGAVEVNGGTRAKLVAHAESGGELRCGTLDERQTFEVRATEMLRLIVATSEFQSG